MGWTSARALGMGNAHVAVAEGTDAIMYNPAMMMKTSGVTWRVMNPRAGIGNPTNLQYVGRLSNITNVAEALSDLYGKNIWAGGGGTSGVTVPYFGVAAYANTEAGIKAQSAPNTRLNLNYYFDYGGAVAIALPFVPEFMSVGVTTRSINRTGTTSVIGPSRLATADPNTLTSELKRRGNAYAVDFGTVMTVPGPISPTFGFTYRNLGYTSFSHNEGAGAPPRIEPEMLVGAALKVDLALITITPAIDYRYIGQNVPMGSNLGLGIEVDLPLIDLRVGMNQGYYTAGVGLGLGVLRADVATWGVELGAYPGQEVDRRYMAQVTIELGFDPSRFFGGSGSGGASGKSGGGGGRRLKQRR